MKISTLFFASALSLAVFSGCEGNETGYDDNDIDAFKESPEEKLEKSDMQDHDQHMQDTSHMHMDTSMNQSM